MELLTSSLILNAPNVHRLVQFAAMHPCHCQLGMLSCQLQLLTTQACMHTACLDKANAHSKPRTFNCCLIRQGYLAKRSNKLQWLPMQNTSQTYIWLWKTLVQPGELDRLSHDGKASGKLISYYMATARTCCTSDISKQGWMTAGKCTAATSHKIISFQLSRRVELKHLKFDQIRSH